MEPAEKNFETHNTEKQAERRDWDRSEWFRLWLELIRQGSSQGAAH